MMPAPAVLAAMTPEATTALGNAPYVRVTVLPFRIGREARSRSRLTNMMNNIERRLNTVPQLNELYLFEVSPPPSGGFNISREHCAIDWVDGQFMLIDRGSACGSTIIESRAKERPSTIATTQIGPYGTARQAVLRDGDLIVLGPVESPYVFRFQVEGRETRMR
jgi:pSer/pThr/pTyr-binding forkhead associated (FHA) protein